MDIVSPDQVGMSSAQLSRLHARMQAIVDEGRLAGIQTLLLRHGQVCYFESHGWQNQAQAQILAPDTIFRIYSMTKPIVSAAIMALCEAGRLQLHDPVSHFLPGFADLQVYVDEHTRVELERPILIHDLLTHTAGLSYGFMDEHPVDALYSEVGNMHNLTNDEFIAALCRLPLVSQPGTTWRYSVATDVLGVLIATLTDLPLGEALTQLILGPLGMVDTGFQVPPASLSRLSTCYRMNEDSTLQAIMEPGTDSFSTGTTFLSGGGGLVSTTADYLRFCRMLLNQGTLEGTRILGRKTVELMRQNHLPSALVPLSADDRGYGFGLGFRVLLNAPLSRRLVGQSEYGWAGAANTYFFIDPQEDMIGIFMSQLLPSGAHDAPRLFCAMSYAALQP